MGSGFEQAMDMTLGTWFPIDFSGLFDNNDVYTGLEGMANAQQDSWGKTVQGSEVAEGFGGYAGAGGW